MIIEDSSLSACGYQLLPLATSYLVGNKIEFDVSDVFGGVFVHYWYSGAYDY